MTSYVIHRYRDGGAIGTRVVYFSGHPFRYASRGRVGQALHCRIRRCWRPLPAHLRYLPAGALTMRYTEHQVRFSRPTYGAIEAAQPAAAGTMPPGWVLDKIAHRKLTGGFSIRKSNRCPNCYQCRSVNGSCGCP